MKELKINEKFALLASVICGGEGVVEFQEVGKKVKATLVWLQIDEVMPRRTPEKVEGVEPGISISRRKAMSELIYNMTAHATGIVNEKETSINDDKNKIVEAEKLAEDLKKKVQKEEWELRSLKDIIDKVR